MTVDELIDICQAVKERSWNVTKSTDMLAEESVEKGEVAELKATHAEEDELTELLDEAREYKTNVWNGTEQLLDQLFAAREAEQRVQNKIMELKLRSEKANARANRERSRADGIVKTLRSSTDTGASRVSEFECL